jgi:hypothetical protein
MKDSVERLVKTRFVLPFALLLLAMGGLAQAASPADCQAYAERVEMDSGSVAGGMGRGAVRGAAFGAIVGDNRKAARRGAAFGAIGGGLRRNAARNEVYRQAYDSCMAGN